ncbi:MAG: adenine phosphoribosyltransferase [Spirochaetales bacterium]
MNEGTMQDRLDRAIRKIPDFPKPGILFYDLTGILMNPAVYAECIQSLKEQVIQLKGNALAAIEARGFLFAAPLARELGIPLILVRKKGKLPGKTLSKTFDLEYGTDTIEVHREDVRPDFQVVLVDDLIATGGTLKAAISLIAEAGSRVVGVVSVVGLPFLSFREKLGDLPVYTLLEYHSE